jgi:hypothetical protein
MRTPIVLLVVGGVCAILAGLAADAHDMPNTVTALGIISGFCIFAAALVAFWWSIDRDL